MRIVGPNIQCSTDLTRVNPCVNEIIENTFEFFVNQRKKVYL